MHKKPTLFAQRPGSKGIEPRSTSTAKPKVPTGLQNARNYQTPSLKEQTRPNRPASIGKDFILDNTYAGSKKTTAYNPAKPPASYPKPGGLPKPLTSLPKAPKLSVQRDTFLSATRKQVKPSYSQGFKNIPRSVIFQVFEFVYTTPADYFTLILLCKDWHAVLADSLQTWRIMKEVSGKNNKLLHELDLGQFADGKALRKVVQKACVAAQLSHINLFMKKVNDMYQYNSMKMNVPNKIMDWLQPMLDIRIGKDIFVGGHKFTYNKLNYAGFIYTEIKRISKLKFQAFDNLKLSLIFRSPKLSESVEFEFSIAKRDILEKCKKTRLFNYYIQKNVALIYFDQDDSILKCLFEISSVHLILRFADIFSRTKASVAKGISAKDAKKFETQHEKLSRQITYDSVEDYLREQTHFEVSIIIHNGKERVFYFVNTTSRPTLSDHPWTSFSEKSEPGKRLGAGKPQSLSKVVFRFEKLGEPLDNPDVYLKLNNELGISEKISDLIFCEVMVKDHEKIRFIDSGLRVFQRDAGCEEMVMDYTAKMALVAEEPGLFSYAIEIHQTEYSLLLNKIEISLSDRYFIS